MCHTIRDQLTISSWLALGACFTFPLYAAFGLRAILPAAGLLLWRIFDAFLMAVGAKRNKGTDGVLVAKFCAQFPDEYGAFGRQPARDGICAILLRARSNHPLGIFAPGFKRIDDRFTAMVNELEDEKSEGYGFLRATRYLGANNRCTNNDVVTMMWFRDADGLRRYAHGEKHKEAWRWWNATVKQHPYLTICHEIYDAPPKHWEAIYVNSEPFGITACVNPVRDMSDAEDKGTAWTLSVRSGFPDPLLIHTPAIRAALYGHLEQALHIVSNVQQWIASSG